jgi:predicted ester cyclase
VQHLQAQLEAFPDSRKLSIKRVYEAGDRAAVVEWAATMKNAGPVKLPDGSELPPTGNDVTIEVVTIYDVENGLITSERNYWDNAGLLAQLGLLPE